MALAKPASSLLQDFCLKKNSKTAHRSKLSYQLQSLFN